MITFISGYIVGQVLCLLVLYAGYRREELKCAVEIANDYTNNYSNKARKCSDLKEESETSQKN